MLYTIFLKCPGFQLAESELMFYVKLFRTIRNDVYVHGILIGYI